MPVKSLELLETQRNSEDPHESLTFMNSKKLQKSLINSKQLLEPPSYVFTWILRNSKELIETPLTEFRVLSISKVLAGALKSLKKLSKAVRCFQELVEENKEFQQLNWLAAFIELPNENIEAKTYTKSKRYNNMIYKFQLCQ